MLKKLGILAAVLTASLAAAVPALAQETIPTSLTQTPNPSLLQSPDGPLENQNDTCTDELLEREPDTDARDCAREEDGTSRGTQQPIEDTKQKAVDDEFGASGDGDATKDAPSTVSEGPSVRMPKEMRPPRLAPRRQQEQPREQGHNLKLGRRAKTSRKTLAARAKLLRSESLTQTKTLLARPAFLRKWLVVVGLLVKGAYPRVMPARPLPKKELLVQTAALARPFARKLARLLKRKPSVRRTGRLLARPLERTPLAAKRIGRLLAKLLTNRSPLIKTPLSARRPPIAKTLSLTGGLRLETAVGARATIPLW